MLLYNIFVPLLLLLLGSKNNSTYKLLIKETKQFIANYKHKRRNLYQNFKFKIDCIFYPTIIAICICNRNDGKSIICSFFLILILGWISLKLIKIIVLYRFNILEAIKNMLRRINIEYTKRLLQKSLIYFLLLILFIYINFSSTHIILNGGKNSILIDILSALFVWGLVEYMSFRYDVIRDVIKERDDCYNNILLYLTCRMKNKDKILLSIVESIGFSQNYYPLTTEYIEIVNLILSNKGKIKKKKIIELYESYTNNISTEFWYYNILNKLLYNFDKDKIDYTKTVYYVLYKELKNIYEV